MYESAAQQEELKSKVDEFFEGYSRLEQKYNPLCRQQSEWIPSYLLFTIGPNYGICPYLDPKYSHQTRIEWLNLLSKYKFTSPSTVLIQELKDKFIFQTQIKEQELIGNALTEKLVSLLNDTCDWIFIENKIKQWLVLTGNHNDSIAKKIAATHLSEIIATCTVHECNFLSIFQTLHETKLPVFALKKIINCDNGKYVIPLTQLEKVLMDKKEIRKRIEKEIFLSKKKLFELAESNYICARVGKINSTYARLDHNTKIDRILEVCFHHSSNEDEGVRLLPFQVEEILASYNDHLDLDHYLAAAWNKKKGIFEEFPFEQQELVENIGTKWKIKSLYTADYVPKRVIKIPKTPLFKPYQNIIQHLLLLEIAQSTQPMVSQQQLMHRVLSRFPLAQKLEAFDYGMKIIEKLNK